jgi:[ribosomal protein S5]-alanine N-acetyltransferase
MKLTLNTKRLRIKLPSEEDAADLCRLAQDNRNYFSRATPSPSADFYTLRYWQDRIQIDLEEYRNQSALKLVLRLEHENAPVIGTVAYTNIVRGVFQACRLGYKIDQAHTGKGLMSEALECTNAYVFDVLDLHRIEANYMPSNNASARILERLGFCKEGFAKDYLFLDGKWQDHVLTSLTNPNIESDTDRDQLEARTNVVD